VPVKREAASSGRRDPKYPGLNVIFPPDLKSDNEVAGHLRALPLVGESGGRVRPAGQRIICVFHHHDAAAPDPPQHRVQLGGGHGLRRGLGG